MTTTDDSRACECGCGEPCRKRFVQGHNRRVTALRPIAERLREKLVRDERTECLEYTGGRGSSGRGHGTMYAGVAADGSQRKALAHRVAWELVNGSVPDGLFVLHKCDNPICCNVDHLFLGSQADNLRDMARKGRGSSGPLPYGVCRTRGGRWMATPHGTGGSVYLGTFDTVEAAAAVAADFRSRALAAGEA